MNPVTEEPWLDSKRLVGPHIGGDFPGAMLEVADSGADFDGRLARWQAIVEKAIDDLGWMPQPTRIRRFTDGAFLMIGAPVDVLLGATEVNEQAWIASEESQCTCLSEDVMNALGASISEESDPAARKLHAAACSHGIMCMVDENGASLGSGIHVLSWGPGEAPAPDSVDFDSIQNVPTALVTGTNGKTTTTRMLATMAKAAGLVAGTTSTDRITIGSEIVDTGDYSGPGGARRVLRDPRVELAILETARGGLLRRGLALTRADVAIVTNIAEDHLGDGGINDLDELADVKFLVTRALTDHDTAVLNFDDERLRRRGQDLTCRITWFALDRVPPPGANACWLENDMVMVRDSTFEGPLVSLQEMPSSLHGHARHNVANALAAAAAARALGISIEAIRGALLDFGRHPDDNPGRAEHRTINGVHYLVDFAHNPHGFRAVLKTARALANGRLAVCFGQAGDRSDDAIVDLTRTAHAAGCDHYMIKEMAEYRRGRTPGEIPGLIRATLSNLGVESDEIEYADTELEAAARLRQWARADDVVALFVHSDRDAVLSALQGG